MGWEYAEKVEEAVDALMVTDRYGGLKICLGETTITDEDSVMLRDALTKNKHLTNLVISQASVTATVITNILAGLKKTLCLTHLDISGCNIGNVGAELVAAFIKTNLTVTVLNLNDNNVGDDGFDAICDILPDNTFVTKLFLENNAATEKSVMSVLNALDDNITLVEVKIEPLKSTRLEKVLKNNALYREIIFNEILTRPDLKKTTFNHDKVTFIGGKDSGKSCTVHHLITNESIRPTEVVHGNSTGRHIPEVKTREVRSHTRVGVFWEEIVEKSEGNYDFVTEHALRAVASAICMRKRKTQAKRSTTSSNVSESKYNMNGLLKRGSRKTNSSKPESLKESSNHSLRASGVVTQKLGNGRQKSIKPKSSLREMNTSARAKKSNSFEAVDVDFESTQPKQKYSTGSLENEFGELSVGSRVNSSESMDLDSFPDMNILATPLDRLKRYIEEVEIDLDSFEELEEISVYEELRKDYLEDLKKNNPDLYEKTIKSHELEGVTEPQPQEPESPEISAKKKKSEDLDSNLDSLTHTFRKREKLREFGLDGSNLENYDLVRNWNSVKPGRKNLSMNLGNMSARPGSHISTFSTYSNYSRMSSLPGVGDMGIFPGMAGTSFNFPDKQDLIYKKKSNKRDKSSNQRKNTIMSAFSTAHSRKGNKLQAQSKVQKEFRRPFSDKYLDFFRNRLDTMVLNIVEYSGDSYFMNYYSQLMPNHSHRRGVNVVCFDMPKLAAAGKEAMHELIFYVQLAKDKSPECPLILIGTKLDKLVSSQDVDKINASVKQVFEFVRPKSIIPNKGSKLLFYPLDNVTGFGVKEVREIISKITRRSENAKKYVSLREMALLDLFKCEKYADSDYVFLLDISEVEFWQKAINIDQNDFESLMELFIDSGFIQQFSDRPCLKDKIVCDTQHLMQAVANALDKDAMRKQANVMMGTSGQIDKGIVSEEVLLNAIECVGPANETNAEFIKRFLQETLLISRHSNGAGSDKREYLIPTLLASTNLPRPKYKIFFDFKQKMLPKCFYFSLLCCLNSFLQRFKGRLEVELEYNRNFSRFKVGDIMEFCIVAEVQRVMLIVPESHKRGVYASFTLMHDMIKEVNDRLGFGLKYAVLTDLNGKMVNLHSVRSKGLRNLQHLFDVMISSESFKVKDMSELEKLFRSYIV